MCTRNPKSYDSLRCCILFFISIWPPIKRLTSASLCLNATTKDDSSSILDLLLRRLYASSTPSFKDFLGFTFTVLWPYNQTSRSAVTSKLFEERIFFVSSENALGWTPSFPSNRLLLVHNNDSTLSNSAFQTRLCPLGTLLFSSPYDIWLSKDRVCSWTKVNPRSEMNM